MNQALLSPAAALVAHIEPLLTERRVLVIGNAERSLAEHLLARGARLVQLLDPDARRVAQAAARNGERRLSYAQLTDSALRDGSFDCAVIEDVNLSDNLSKLVSGVARALSPRGVAVFCASSADHSTGLLGATRGAVDYDALVEATEERFEVVRILGQSPFLGYSVVDLELDHPPEPALDNAYLGGVGETADFYIAVCGSADSMAHLGLEEMTIVQLPAARFVENSEKIQRERELRTARRIESLENDLKNARQRGSDKDVERLTRELGERDTWIHKLESRAETADARADDAERELEEVEEELDRTHKLLVTARAEHKTEIDRLKADAKKSAALPEELKALRVELETARKAALELKDVRAELQKAQAAAREANDLRAELKKSQSAAREAADLRAELVKARAAATEAKHLIAGRDALEEEVTALDEENQKLLATLKDRARMQEKLERRLAEAEKELDDLHDQLEETEELLAAAKKDTSKVTVSEVERDLRGLEDQLRQRGERVALLEGQLKKLETYAKTLTAELSLKNGQGGSSQEELEALSKALAEREADLVEARWTIGQLQKSTLRG
jgi:chromosome segregation ATPase